jgi:3-phosphoshikimate 1-carboxyvinyltransferase
MGPTGRDVVETHHAPNGVAGAITVPPSKSLTQRALVAAAVAGPGSRLIRPLDADDPRLLFGALRKAGFRLTWAGGTITAGGRTRVDAAALHMGNNGTGMRLLVAQLAGLPGAWEVDGSQRLRERPVAPLVGALRALGATIESRSRLGDELPLRVVGASLTGGSVGVDAAGSSQFVSALLLLGATLPGGLVVRLTNPPPSRPYVALTAHVLEAFGSSVVAGSGGTQWSVRGGGLSPTDFEVEGDWSAAAFPMAAAAVAGGEVEVVGVRRDSAQGDAAVLDVLGRTGCTVRDSARGVVVGGPARTALTADLRDTPDLFPALSVVVARVGGRLTGLGGLAVKESDRLAVMADRLARLGFSVEIGGDWFASPGGVPGVAASREPIDPAGDHRIAMALAVAGCVVAGIRVSESGCVGKSWPGFWDAWDGLLRGGW